MKNLIAAGLFTLMLTVTVDTSEAISLIQEDVILVECKGGHTNAGRFWIASSDWNQTKSECNQLGGYLVKVNME